MVQLSILCKRSQSASAETSVNGLMTQPLLGFMSINTGKFVVATKVYTDKDVSQYNESCQYF